MSYNVMCTVVVKVDRRIRWHYTTTILQIVNLTISLALSAGTLMASGGTPYRLVPAHFYPWCTETKLCKLLKLSYLGVYRIVVEAILQALSATAHSPMLHHGSATAIGGASYWAVRAAAVNFLAPVGRGYFWPVRRSAAKTSSVTH